MSKGHTTAVPVCLLSGLPSCSKSVLVRVLARSAGYDTVKVIDTSSILVCGVNLMMQLKLCVLSPARCLVVLEDADMLCAIADSYKSDSSTATSHYTLEDLLLLVSSLSQMQKDHGDHQPTHYHLLQDEVVHCARPGEPGTALRPVCAHVRRPT